jgi:hypothetical protein
MKPWINCFMLALALVALPLPTVMAQANNGTLPAAALGLPSCAVSLTPMRKTDDYFECLER